MLIHQELVLACSKDRSNHNSSELLHRPPVVARAHLRVKTMMALAMAKTPTEIATY